MNEVLKAPSDFLGYEYDYGLVGASALGQVAAPDGKQAVHTIDQGNAFTSIRTPKWWWCMLGGPVVLCSELPAAWTAGRWAPSRRLRPQYMRLPMGETRTQP